MSGFFVPVAAGTTFAAKVEQWSSQDSVDTTTGASKRALPRSTRPRARNVRSRCEFIKTHQHSIETMCRLLGVARRGYYKWLTEPISKRARDARLLCLIRASFTASEGIYGAPRAFLDLISPLLANLFLHYALDVWLRRECEARFCRYADGAVIHCQSEAQARLVLREARRAAAGVRPRCESAGTSESQQPGANGRACPCARRDRPKRSGSGRR